MPVARIDFEELRDLQKVDFLSLTPQPTNKKNPIFGLLVAKVGPFGSFGVVCHTHPLATGLSNAMA